LFKEVPRRTLDSWAFCVFTKHPRDNRFAADEFAAELARHGLHGTGRIEDHFAGMVFIGAARKSDKSPRPAPIHRDTRVVRERDAVIGSPRRNLAKTPDAHLSLSSWR
jgi:hypothetical protein